MSLPEIYEKLFGKQAAEKKADEAAETKAEAGSETNEAAAEEKSEYTDEEIEQALSQMSEEELAALAKETAADIKESKAKEQEAHQKEAEELYAAGRIFGQGFLAEVNGKPGAEKTAETKKAAEPEKKSAISKFAALLDKELKAEPAKK
jgi:uncharacterized protein YciI